MKIVIDARMLGWSGIGRYTAKLLQNLQAIDNANNYLVLLNQRAYDGWQPTNHNFSKIRANFRPYSFGEQLRLPRLITSLKPDLVHFLSFNSPWFYNGPRVTTIHDLTLLAFWPGRGLASRIKYQPMRLVLGRSVKKSQQLLVPSEYVKGQVSQRYGKSEKKITITHEAAELVARAEPTPGLTGKQFLLYVGNAYPHKNLERLLQAYELLGADFEKLELVFCGANDYFYRQLKQKAGKGCRFIHGASDPQLRWLYENAKAVVMPSLSEGFGLPGLEAMACGTPVAAAKASCLPEIYGQGATYFDPQNPGDMAKNIKALLSDSKLAGRLRSAGYEQVKKYSWRATAAKTLAVYSQLSSKDQAPKTK